MPTDPMNPGVPLRRQKTLFAPTPQAQGRREIPMTPEQLDKWMSDGAPDLGGDPVVSPSAGMQKEASGAGQKVGRSAGGVDATFTPQQISRKSQLANAMLSKSFEPAHNWGDVLKSGLAGYLAGKYYREADKLSESSAQDMKAYTGAKREALDANNKEKRFWHLMNALKGSTYQAPDENEEAQ